jgi:hypothetical protein
MIKRLNQFIKESKEDRDKILFDKLDEKFTFFRDLLIDLEHDGKIENYYFYYACDLKYKLGMNSLLKTRFNIKEDNIKNKIEFFIKLILKTESNVVANKRITDPNFKLDGRLSMEVIYERRYKDITDDLLELAEVSNVLKANHYNSELSLGSDAKIRLSISDNNFL